MDVNFPFHSEASQLKLTCLLGSVYYTKPGQYSRFNDSRIDPLVTYFQQSLIQIEGIISAKNSVRRRPYEFLLPSNIPQITNI
jgi:arachidonate 15-lipoxygenase